MLGALQNTVEKLSPQDLVALGVVAFALVICLVCFPCYLAFVAATGCGPTRAQSICTYILRLAKQRSKFNFHKIDDHLYLGSLPRTMEDLEKLKALGVGAMVTLNEAWEMELSNRFVRDDCGLEQLHLPTPDFFAPKQEDIQAAVQFITAFVDQGIGVYVHCDGGKGRSAVCVICFLARQKKLSAESAYDHVISLRHIAPMRASCCGLHKQWRAVKRFCRHFVRTGRRQEAFTNKPSNNPSNVSQPGDVSQRNLPTSPARSKCSGDTVRNVEKEDETSKREANCGEVTAKPQDLAAASQSCSQQQEEIGPAQDESMPEQSPKLSCGETSAGLISGDDPPPAHVAIDAEPLAPLNAPQPHASEYDENLEPESDSDEEPPLLE